MPTVHVIGNVKIKIHGNDHAPPHFHARVNYDEEAIVRIDNLNLMQNNGLKQSDLKATMDWARDNQQFLALKWVEIVES